MEFVNRSKKSIHVRIGKRLNFSWSSVRPGETIDLPEGKGKRFGLEKVPNSDQELPKVTEGKIGKTKVETKQFEYTPDDLFFKELTKIKGIGSKTAEDIVNWGTKEKLIEAIKLREHLPFRDDVEKKLRRKYGI